MQPESTLKSDRDVDLVTNYDDVWTLHLLTLSQAHLQATILTR